MLKEFGLQHRRIALRLIILLIQGCDILCHLASADGHLGKRNRKVRPVAYCQLLTILH